jgi:hypothetical protein
MMSIAEEHSWHRPPIMSRVVPLRDVGPCDHHVEPGTALALISDPTLDPQLAVSGEPPSTNLIDDPVSASLPVPPTDGPTVGRSMREHGVPYVTVV